jgi:hypothetical protein
VSIKRVAPTVLAELLALVGGPSPTCGGLPTTAKALASHIAAIETELAQVKNEREVLWRLILKVAPVVAVLSRAHEVAPPIRAELEDVERMLLALGAG